MSDGVTSILLDTNILLSRTLRDWFFLLSERRRDKIYTTQDILDEWEYHWPRKYPRGSDAQRVKIKRRIIQYSTVVEGYSINSKPGYPDENDLHIHAAMVEHNIDYLVTNDKALLDYWEKSENIDDPLPYVTISADEFLMTYAEPHLGRSDQKTCSMSPTDLKNIYSFQEEHFVDLYGEADLCGALERAEAPCFADYLRHHIVPLLL